MPAVALRARSAARRVARLARPAALAFALVVAAAGIAPAWSSAAAADEAAEPLRRHRAMVTADSDGRDRLVAHEFDIAGYDLRQGRVEVITDDAGLARLGALGFAYEIVETRSGLQPLGAGANDAPLPDTLYRDPAEVAALLRQTLLDHPSITRLVTLGTSHEGRAIEALVISDNAAVSEDELAILFNAAHHAREVMTIEVVLDIIEQLTDGYGVDPELTAFVDAYEIWCVPVVNPDGVTRVFQVDDFWRKNNRDNDANGSITSADGVDLNRNYEWGFGNQCRGSSSSTSSETYRGPWEASEPESQAMIELSRATRPVFDVEYHSYGEDVFYALSCDPFYSPKLSTIPQADKSISRLIGELYAAEIVQADGGVGYSPAPYGSRVDGTGRDQQSFESGTIAFVVEINSSGEGGFHPDYATWRQPTVEGHRPGWRWLVERMGGPAVGGHVRDAATGAPLAADVALDELTLPDGRRLTSAASTGRFHIVTIPGSYTLRVAREGYEPAVVPVSVGEGLAPIELLLVPTGATTIAAIDFEDPAQAAQWITSLPQDLATDGRWEWGEPFGTHTGDVQTTLLFGAPRIDATPGAGKHAFVTGNARTTLWADDDLDNGDASLVSPPFELSAFYAVDLVWQRWFRKDPVDALDAFHVDVTVNDGATWIPLDTITVPTSTADAAPAWVSARVRLDEIAAPAANTRFRFRAIDYPPDHVVEAAIDDMRLLGYALATDGDVRGVGLLGNDATVLTWLAVPGGAGATYDVVRGDLANLSGDTNLGPLACIENNSADTSTTGDADATTPAPGTGFFYLVRFELGLSTGGYGASSAGGARTGSGGCAD